MVDSFTDRLFDGNRAGVVPRADGLDERLMQLIAAEINASETAFVHRAADADFHFRFFAPGCEVPFCGHAFVGAAACLGERMAAQGGFESGRLKIRTGAGFHDVDLKRSATGFQVTLTQAAPLFRPNPHPVDLVASALGLDYSDFDDAQPMTLAYTGLWHLLVGLREAEAVKRCKPDFAKLAAINIEAGVATTHLYAKNGGGWFCRGFAPAVGVDEDPVTGSASGALGAYLVKIRREAPQALIGMEQRNPSGRGGRVEVWVGGTPEKPEVVKITGNAVISMTGEVATDEGP